MDNNYTAFESNNDNNDSALVEIGEVRFAFSPMKNYLRQEHE